MAQKTMNDLTVTSLSPPPPTLLAHPTPAPFVPSGAIAFLPTPAVVQPPGLCTGCALLQTLHSSPHLFPGPTQHHLLTSCSLNSSSSDLLAVLCTRSVVYFSACFLVPGVTALCGQAFVYLGHHIAQCLDGAWHMANVYMEYLQNEQIE